MLNLTYLLCVDGCTCISSSRACRADHSVKAGRYSWPGKTGPLVPMLQTFFVIIKNKQQCLSLTSLFTVPKILHSPQILGYTEKAQSGSTISNGIVPKGSLGQVFNSKLGRIGKYCMVSACHK